MADINKLYSTEEVMNYIGTVCKDLSLMRDKSNRLDAVKDLEIDRLHRICYGAIENMGMLQDIDEVDGVSISRYLKDYPEQYEYFVKFNGIDFIDNIKRLAKNTSLSHSVSIIKKFSLLRQFEKLGFSTKEIYDTSLVDSVKISVQREKFEKMSESDIRKFFKLKLFSIQEDAYMDDNETFQAGDGILELIEKCQLEPKWGYAFQSTLYNAVFRGMLGKKVMIRSASSGAGKSRMALMDLCSVSVKEMYNVNHNKWIPNPRATSSLFITTELEKEEVQLILLATVSGVEEEIIKNGNYTEEVRQRILKAAHIIKESSIHIEYMANFSLTDLESAIELNVAKYETGFVFFDYIQITSGVATELQRLFGYSLREDQMLNMIVSSLKTLANKYDIYISTSTQLNRSYKTDNYIDATHMRGGMATIDKADYGIITVKASNSDLTKLEPIIRNKINSEIPTHAHHVFKNRGGKYTGIIIWTHINLGNMRLEDCFVTNQDYEEFFIEGKIL